MAERSMFIHGYRMRICSADNPANRNTIDILFFSSFCPFFFGATIPATKYYMGFVKDEWLDAADLGRGAFERGIVGVWALALSYSSVISQ